MNLGTLLLIVLVILLVGGYVVPLGGGPYLGTGWNGGGVLGIVLVVVLVLVLLGRI